MCPTIQLRGFVSEAKPRLMTKKERTYIKQLLCMEYNYYVQFVNNANKKKTKKRPKGWDEISGRLDELQSAIYDI